MHLNVSQNQFIESEQRTIETEGNVLAFRFLLERFAQQQVPETRFQVVLTAFQTLAENSDLQPIQSASWLPGSASAPSSDQDQQQFICDSQRLISANLACDGFKNCQDGHDEEPAICLALRQSQQQQPNGQPGGGNPARRPLDLIGGDSSRNSQNHHQLAASDPSLRQQSAGKDLAESSWPTRLLASLGFGGGSPTSGASQSTSWWSHWQTIGSFLLGFLLVLVLLTCCTCCLYLAYLIWRRRHREEEEEMGDNYEDDRYSTSGRGSSASLRMSASGRRRTPESGDREESVAFRSRPFEGLAESDGHALEQNLENVARMKAAAARLLPAMGGGGARHQQPPPPPVQRKPQQLQSILKRPPPPMPQPAGPAPLARFEVTGSRAAATAQLGRRPMEPPPQVPARTPRAQGVPQRGALASSLNVASADPRDSAPRLGPSMARLQQQHFRPTPAARRQSASRSPSVEPTLGLPTPDAGPAPTPTQPARDIKQQQQQAPGDRLSPRGSKSSGTGGGGGSSYAMVSSRSTSTEKTSAITGNQRVTVYKYSSDVAKYSESYLMTMGRSQARPPSAPFGPAETPAGASGPSPSGQQQPPEAAEQASNLTPGADSQASQQVPRQSSLI